METSVTSAIRNFFSKIPGFNRPTDFWISGEEALGKIDMLSESNRYAYAVIKSSQVTNITGILWDKKTAVHLVLFESILLMGTRKDAAPFHMSYSIDGEFLNSYDFFTKRSRVAKIEWTPSAGPIRLVLNYDFEKSQLLETKPELVAQPTEEVILPSAEEVKG